MDKVLEGIIKKINKEYDQDIAYMGNDENILKYELVPFSSPRLTYMMYGGLPMGRMIEFAGAERSGKTTTAMDMIKQCQIKFKKEFEEDKKEEERKVCFIDVENTFDEKWAKVNGVDLSKLLLIKPQDQYAEQIFEIILEIVATGSIGLVVLDSVAQLQSKQSMEVSMEQKLYGGIAQSLTRFCNRVIPLLGSNNCMCIMINQVREDLTNPYNTFITPRWKRL